jgi:phage terminase large subunit-like protein
MVRWHPMPPDLPEAVADFKRALRKAIDGAGYLNLGLLAQTSGVPASTISDAASRATVIPSKTVLVKILRACKSPELSDSRYGNWQDLHEQACSALNSPATNSDATESRKKQRAIQESVAIDERPPLAVYRSTVTRKGRSETTEIFFYSEAAVQHLIDRHVDRKPSEAGDDQ